MPNHRSTDYRSWHDSHDHDTRARVITHHSWVTAMCRRIESDESIRIDFLPWIESHRIEIIFGESVCSSGELVVHLLVEVYGPAFHATRYDYAFLKQESPAIADEPARRESLPKLLQLGVPTTLSLTILAYLHAFNCYCVRNPRPEKFTENSNLWSSRSSKITDLGANRKPICDLLLVINSNFSRICYRFRDIHG